MLRPINRRLFLAGGTATLALAGPRAEAGDGTDAFVVAQMAIARIPGLALGVVRDGRVRLARGYGFADMASHRRVTGDTLFHIASITKTITATAVMMLVEDGRFGLDDPIARYLDFPVVNPAHPNIPIRVRHLLMHTSSISEAAYQTIDFRVRGKDSPLGLADFLKSLLVPGGRYYSPTGCYSPAKPGAVWDYVNTGYALLGYLAGRVAGEDLRSYVRKRIFAPLRMDRSVWTLADVPPKQAATPYDDDAQGKPVAVAPVAFPDWPAGMMRSSMADFTRFLAAAANGGAAYDHRLLRPESMAEMLTMARPAGLPDWLSGQGLAWAESDLGGVRRPNHWGGDPGVFTVAYLDPATRSGVAIFTNATATTERKTAVKAIAAHLLTAEGRHGADA